MGEFICVRYCDSAGDEWPIDWLQRIGTWGKPQLGADYFEKIADGTGRFQERTVQSNAKLFLATHDEFDYIEAHAHILSGHPIRYKPN